MCFRWPFNCKKVPKATTPATHQTHSPNQTFHSLDLQDGEDYELECTHIMPLGIFTVLWMVIVYFFQFIGMVYHRLTTLGHIVSTTDLGLMKVSIYYYSIIFCAYSK